MANVSIHSIRGQGYVLSDKPLAGWAAFVPARGDLPAAYRWPDNATTYKDVARRLKSEGHVVIHTDEPAAHSQSQGRGER